MNYSTHTWHLLHKPLADISNGNLDSRRGSTWYQGTLARFLCLRLFFPGQWTWRTFLDYDKFYPHPCFVLLIFQIRILIRDKWIVIRNDFRRIEEIVWKIIITATVIMKFSIVSARTIVKGVYNSFLVSKWKWQFQVNNSQDCRH